MPDEQVAGRSRPTRCAVPQVLKEQRRNSDDDAGRVHPAEHPEARRPVTFQTSGGIRECGMERKTKPPIPSKSVPIVETSRELG